MVYETSFDPTSEPASTAVIRTLAVANDMEPLAIPPLFESIDPDALDAVFRRSTGEAKRVAFTHSKCQVEVLSEGRIRVWEANAVPP